MKMFDRREFLGASLGGLAALSAGSRLPGRDARRDASALDTLFLTWRRDPTTTMVVQWIGPPASPEDSTIHFSIADAQRGDKKDPGGQGIVQSVPTKRHPYPMTDLHVFRAELGGLSPGTEYQFQIGKNAMTRRFRTMPAKATDSFQFVSGGDCDTNPHAIANNILAAKQDPMFAVIGGDLGYDDGKKVEQSLGFVRNYSRHMIDTQGRLIPMVVCLGNHEVNGGYGKSRNDAPFFFALHDGLYAERSYATLDFGDYLSLVLLDSGHCAAIDGEQTAWLDKVLTERAERPHLFAVNHVPSYPSHRKPEGILGKAGTGELSRKHWVPLFERHNVDAVFEHHDHTFKRTHPLKDGMKSANGIVYLGDGSWGKLRAPQAPENHPYLATADEAYHLSLHRLEGEKCHHVAMKEGGQVIDTILTTSKRPLRSVGRS